VVTSEDERGSLPNRGVPERGRSPGGITHDFQNRGCERAGVLNFSARGTFEEQMPAIVEWFTDNPPGEAIA
jgi:hypothetical protein